MISRNPQKLQAVTHSRACDRTMQRAEQAACRRAATGPAAAPKSAIRKPGAARGLSLVELLIALAITAALLAATMVAIDASFKAYAAAAETASVQTATRMVVNRLMTLIRTSYAVGPAVPSDVDAGFTTPDFTQNPYRSDYLELFDSSYSRVRLQYDADEQTLTVVLNVGEANEATQPLLTGVTRCDFFLQREQNPRNGIWEVVRGSIDIEVEPDEDNTLAIEADSRTPVRAIASTMPRKLE